jgi:hypothetical protein
VVAVVVGRREPVHVTSRTTSTKHAGEWCRLGYVMNRWSVRVGEPRASSLSDAVKACLS